MGVRGWPIPNGTEAGRTERSAASEREVWQGWDRKGTKESEEYFDFKVAGKATVGGDSVGKLIFLLNC